jgi:ferritin-like protein
MSKKTKIVNLYEALVIALQEDLGREYLHMHFYIYAAAAVVGPHRLALKELFQKEAHSELNHVQEFTHLLKDMDIEVPTEVTTRLFDSKLTDVERDIWKVQTPDTTPELLQKALKLEQEVVENYVERQQMAEIIAAEGDATQRIVMKHLSLFLDKQIEDSYESVLELRKLLS